ncbi:AAA family ATPase [Pyxidicoccus xibeiensis]|uniref:AAA family ATPase n=1 Tax=Pyxidicoccus xibeiensis TaxID=2906759 RepID=UPI0020A6FF2F|nr:ATP-binding protein [Pyxidicoccus xibeiensis]MCP3143880.1 ATP-binding protein [Pyxidicoccus xibeiensis]
MAHIHLVVGPVAAGKSTFALRLAQQHRAVRMNLDEWMAQLFRPDRPEVGVMEWYIERTARCIEQIWRQTTRTLEVGTDVVLEIGLILRRDRERLYERVDARGDALTIYVLDAPRDVRRERVLQRNREKGETFSMEVPLAFFELASDRWEPLDEVECDGRDVRFISTEKGASTPPAAA